MIAKLRGLIDAVGDDWAVIDVGGVGYLVACSARTLARLPRPGEAAALLVETHVREDAILLFGFLDGGEREWFRLLTTVQGVGAKVALAILSVLAPEQLVLALAAKDKTELTRASGVGPKLAARIVAELEGKAGRVPLSPGLAAAGAEPGGTGVAGGGAVADAVSALVNLGYRRIEAHGAVVAAARALGEGGEAPALIRAGLKELARELER